jgi:DedD protein
VERQLQERVIGAAVLVAVAIILIPEMLSGPKIDSSKSGANSRSPASTAPSNESANEPANEPTSAVKTVSIDLNKNDSGKTPAQNFDTLNATRDAPATAQSLESPIAQAAVAPNAVVENKPAPAKTATEVESKPKPQPQSSAVASGWAVQVASLGARDAADRLAAEIKQQGHPAFVMAFQIKDKTLFRVRVGPVAERRAADELLTKIKREYPAATVVTHP